MDHIVLLICLFPVVFMLHDFEEIIMQHEDDGKQTYQ